MAVNLSKGAKISLAKAASDSGMAAVPTKLCVGLGWDTNKYDCKRKKGKRFIKNY